MPRNTSCRKYQITINNPETHGFTHEVIRTNLEKLPSCLYWCMADEIGEKGTPHTHVYFFCKNAVEFPRVQKLFYGAHIEPAVGSDQDNRDYIRKEGKWLSDEKHGTSVPGTFEESGELPEAPDKRRKFSEELYAMIKDGASDFEILEKLPSAMTRLQHITAVRQIVREEERGKGYREIKVHYLHGKTRTGKTRYVMDKHGSENVYRVTSYQHPFDNYDGESVLLLDEYRSSLPFADMLKYLEGYFLRLPCRYANKVACYTEVYVASNIPLSQQHLDIKQKEPDSWDAFFARFTDALEFPLGSSSQLADLPDDIPVPFEVKP